MAIYCVVVCIVLCGACYMYVVWYLLCYRHVAYIAGLCDVWYACMICVVYMVCYVVTCMFTCTALYSVVGDMCAM